ncbi:MAG: carboxypeptidase-like regulatory domain-containing protein [Chloroflexi bacterium]|nr:carboxypeptidase-like regulatory domain-containing protein [Chloroflexota bacterium]
MLKKMDIKKSKKVVSNPGRYFIVFVLISFAAFVCVGCGGGGGGGGASGQTTGTISGTVRDYGNDGIIVGVDVSVDQSSFTSDNGGWYSIAGIQPGEKTILAEAPGYYPFTGTVTVESGELLDYTVRLISTDAATVEGTVSDSGSGVPVADVTVAIGDLRGITDAAGTYSIAGVPVGSGTQTITGTRPQYEFYSSTVPVASGITATRDFTMNPVVQATGACSGVVTSSTTGSPVQGASVRFIPSDPQYQSQVIEVSTGADGSYSVILVADRDYELKCLKDGYFTAAYSSGSVGDGGAETQDIEMVPTSWGEFPGLPFDQWGQ